MKKIPTLFEREYAKSSVPIFVILVNTVLKLNRVFIVYTQELVRSGQIGLKINGVTFVRIGLNQMVRSK